MPVDTIDQAPAAETVRGSFAYRLAKSIKFGDKRMDAFRKNRLKHLRQFAGTWYGHDTPEKAEPLNLVFSVVRAMLPNLVIEPRTMVSARHPRFRAFAELLALAINRVIKEIRFGDTVCRAIVDSFFGPGVLYTGLAAGAGREVADQQGYLHDPDEPFSEHIDIADYIPDPYATKRESYSFESHRFRAPFEWAMDTRLFRRDLLESLGRAGQDRQREARSHAEQLSTPQGPEDENWVEQIELVSAWLPDYDLIVTLPSQLDDTRGVLSEAEWIGPDTGPYDVFGYMDVPSNTMPISPIGQIFDLHELVNELARKIKRQAERQKDIGVYESADEWSAENIRTASDGDMVPVKNKDRVGELHLGGVDPKNYESVEYFERHLNEIAGNPALMGGIEAKSGTLGQDQMLYASASGNLDYWRGRIKKTLDRVLEKIGYFVWSDPVREMQLVQTLPGGIQVPQRWTPEERQGAFEDYQIEIQAYGIRADSPEQQYARILDLCERFVLPAAQIAMAQGTAPNMAVLFEVLGKVGDIPRADEIFQPVAAPPIGMQQPGQTQLPARNTTTNISMGGQARPRPAPQSALAPKKEAPANV